MYKRQGVRYQKIRDFGIGYMPVCFADADNEILLHFPEIRVWARAQFIYFIVTVNGNPGFVLIFLLQVFSQFIAHGCF